MSKTVKVVVIDHDPLVRDQIVSTLSSQPYMDVLAETESFVYGYELIRQNRPDVVFVDIREDPHRTYDLIKRITTYFKDTMIVVSGHEISLESIMAAMQSGAREFLKRPIQASDLNAMLEKHHQAFVADASGDNSGRILTVFSNKGGLGKTTIAVNLALSLSEITKKPVALVDLNLQLGDITTFLDIMPRQTIVDIAKNIGRVDATYLETSLAEFRHVNSHVYVLADPLNVEEAEEVTAEQINTVLTVLKATFEYVIIDTTTSFDSKTLTALDLADQILLVSMVNLPNIRSSQRVLNLFDRLGYDRQKVKLLINRYLPDDEITIQDVEETLGHEVSWKIPNNYQAIMTAINRGIPISTLQDGKMIYQNFIDLACQISGIVLQQTKKETKVPVPVKAKLREKDMDTLLDNSSQVDSASSPAQDPGKRKKGFSPKQTPVEKPARKSLFGNLFGKKK